ncbi:AI-2E family transporter [Rhodobacter sp. Har01]|uniref:AI-2E family transporter n=1 Tax=Rhodobacter sp. Har01 TaxID=2883999 RepID=UPI001D0672C3|nr:AI-2E family transporter [Rhodobacter sp. Har01]MCB6179510.1 AI-2E family transporter [Rhodobacter sp. Har01]
MRETDSAGTLATDAAGRRITLPRMVTIVGVAAVLALAADVFLPLAVAMLITFALSPLVSVLRRRGLSKTLSVILSVTLAFLLIGAFSLVVALQVGQLAQNLPEFQANILAKLNSLKESGQGGGLIARVTDMVVAINAEIGRALPAEAGAASGPMPVEVVERSNALQMLQNIVGPLLSPIAMTGLVVVVVIFMLLERDQLRDRFIRLAGSQDIHRMTEVLEDAGSRVANYLLIQLLVNLIYAVPIGIGLWLIGVPNALLWGVLTLVLRFVPYVGSVLAAAFPLFLAFAVSPDWSAVLWTLALFGTVETVTSNLVEPWVYGSRTGLSPLAIIVAAIFWTFLWGPLGLVLSTPLTVCLVVLGRHLPQFEMFDILFGDEPVLHPHMRLYQRLLAGDATEATFAAEEALEDEDLAAWYQATALPALLKAQDDRDRGVLTREQELRLAATAQEMVANLTALAAEEAQAEAGEDADAPPSGKGLRVACVGGRWDADAVSAAMLAQVTGITGAEVRSHGADVLAPARLVDLHPEALDCLVLCFLDPSPSRASLLHVQRIKRLAPKMRVGVVIWQLPPDLRKTPDAALMPPPATREKLAEVEEIGADFVSTTMEEAVAAILKRAEPRRIDAPRKRAALKPRRRAADAA